MTGTPFALVQFKTIAQIHSHGKCSRLLYIKKYHELKENGFTHSSILGILRTMYDKLLPLSSRISSELETSFNELLFKTKITYNPRISESSSAAVPVLLYDRTSLGSQEYLSFTGEVLKKLRTPQS